MSEKDNKAVTNWLFIVCGLIMFMVVFGGYVRLTRSGLSIVEWKPIAGVIPPIGDEAWQLEFEKYQQTPEFQKVNKDMTLEGYKWIFYNEYIHRLIARFAGLVVVLPLFYFLWKGIIPWRKSAVYLAIAALFGFQGYLGWYMVSSGLRDVPSVSPYRLTIHLLLALFLLAMTLWMALNHRYGFPLKVEGATRSSPFVVSVLVLAVLVLQISYGGLVAGMKAAATIIVPFLLSAFIAIICAPIINSLKNRGMPMWLALATVVALIGIAGTLIISILGNSIHSFSMQLPEYQSRLQAEINQFFAWLKGHGIDWYDAELRQYINPNVALGFVGRIFNGLGSLLASSFLIFLTVMFLLFEGVALKDKMLTIYGDAADQQTRQISEFLQSVNKYMAIKSMTSFATGLLISLWVWMLGVDYALLWGLLVSFLQAMVAVNRWPLAWMGYDTAISQTTFALQQIAIALAQFVLYIAAATTADDPQSFAACSGSLSSSTFRRTRRRCFSVPMGR